MKTKDALVPHRDRSIVRTLRKSWGLLFVLPAGLLLFLTFVWPSIQGTVYAFTDWDGLSSNYDFIGLGNFIEMWNDELARKAITNTLVITVVLLVLENLIGLLLALAVHSKVKSKGLLRVIFFAPVVVTPVVVAALWRYLYTPSGPINEILGLLGLEAWQRQWLADPELARGAIIVVILWQFSGYLMVIYLAGLQGVPTELTEAAQIDGAGPFRVFFSIVLPMLKPALTVGLVLVAIRSLKIFDQVWVMTKGGPGDSTQTLSSVMYVEAFMYGSFGYATAIAVVLTLLCVGLAVLQVRLVNKKELA